MRVMLWAVEEEGKRQRRKTATEHDITAIDDEAMARDRVGLCCFSFI